MYARSRLRRPHLTTLNEQESITAGWVISWGKNQMCFPPQLLLMGLESPWRHIPTRRHVRPCSSPASPWPRSPHTSLFFTSNATEAPFRPTSELRGDDILHIISQGLCDFSQTDASRRTRMEFSSTALIYCTLSMQPPRSFDDLHVRLFTVLCAIAWLTRISRRTFIAVTGLSELRRGADVSVLSPDSLPRAFNHTAAAGHMRRRWRRCTRKSGAKTLQLAAGSLSM